MLNAIVQIGADLFWENKQGDQELLCSASTDDNAYWISYWLAHVHGVDHKTDMIPHDDLADHLEAEHRLIADRK